ncbi:MAG: M20/M25/M40 family metallo-hydrolase [Cycloclasticus sp.]
MDINNLRQFISFQSVDNNPDGNKQAIAFVLDALSNMGFSCRIEGQNTTDQPCIIGHFPGRDSSKKIVLYGHYDVAPIDTPEEWQSQDPFTIEEIGGRYFARGIADNKGPLLARLEAIAELMKTEQAIPEILWLIQGEEEILVDERVAEKIFRNEITQFGGNVFVDETGFNDIDSHQQILFLWSPSHTEYSLVQWHPLFNGIMDESRIEFRHLNKLTGVKGCPLLGGLPEGAVYIGFGPNDKLHQIHRKNESLDVEKLNFHKQQFKEFIGRYAEYSCNE